MAKGVKAQKTIDSWKAKRWHKILAPKLFQEQEIGETPALEPSMLLGRTVQSNLLLLLKDFKKQHVEITLEVCDIKGNTAFTRVKRYEISPSYIKKTVRREKDRIDDSFSCTTSDGVHVRIKPFVLTRFKTKNSIATAIRAKTKQLLQKMIQKQTYDQLVEDLVTYKIQKTLWEELKKVYPLRTFEIRMMALEKQDGKKPKPAIEEASAISEENNTPAVAAE